MPRSIGGFNSSTYGSFGEGDQISARALNRMGVGIDRATTMYSQGIQFQASNGGVAYNNPQEVVLTDGMGVTPSYQSVNHYECKVFTIDGVSVLRVARGGNIWRPMNSDCDSQLRTDDITVGPLVTLTPGTNPTSPWASNDGYVTLTGATLFVYAYQVETATDCNFYIYVSLDPGLDSSCPVTLPDGIDAPTEAYTVQVIRIADIVNAGVDWIVNQFVLGSITWPQTVGGAATEYVNQFELAIKDVDSVPVLKVASGGHIYRPVSSTCDKTDFTDVITPDPTGPSPVVVVTGTGTSVPWASDDGYVEISAGVYYVYAFKVESESGASFYIYVSKDGTLDESCPVALRPPMIEPSEPYTVQCLKIGSATYAEGAWTIDQKLVGSITWPSSSGSVAADTEQFKVEVSGNNVKVAKGRIVAMHSLDFPLMYTLDQKMLEFNVEGFAVYPDGSRVEGGNPNSVWCSQNGYVTITNAEEKNDWGVYIIRNQLGPYGDLGTYPLLAVMTDDSDAYDKSKAFPPGTGSSGQYHWGAYQEIINVTISGPDGGSGKLIGSVMPYALKNFCCERLKIASITWDADTSKWVVTQHLIGSLTIPSNIVGGVVTEVTTLPPYPTSSLPGFKTECQAWFDAWTGYTKILTPSSGYTTSIIES